jgi:hypothetical protein
MATKTTGRDLVAELAFLTRALKAPTLRTSVARLAERARTEGWSHEEFLAACLQREVAAGQAHGGEGRIRHARSPARKSLEEFDYTMPAASSVTPSPTSARWIWSRHGRTWCSSAHPGPARPPGDRAEHPGLPGRPPGGLRHRRRLGRAPGRRPHRWAPAGRAGPAGPLPLLVIDEVGYIPSSRRPPTCSSSWSRPATNARR